MRRKEENQYNKKYMKFLHIIGLLCLLQLIVGCTKGVTDIDLDKELIEDKPIQAIKEENKEFRNKIKDRNIIEKPLPKNNYEDRKEDITHIVLHFISNVVNNPENPYDIEDLYSVYKEYGVSTHYMIGRKGEIYQLVLEDKIAYHAGEGSLPDFPQYKDQLNKYSIGIEIMAIGTEEEMKGFISADIYQSLDQSFIDYTEEQYNSLNILLKNIQKNNPAIKHNRKHIVGHDEYAKDRKTDPGSLFKWSKIGL